MVVGNSIISMQITPFLYKLRIFPELVFFWNLIYRSEEYTEITFLIYQIGKNPKVW